VSSLVTAAAVMGGLALLFGVILAIAYRFLKVVEDPRIDDVESMLPGSNCGACGSPGCRAFAEALVAATQKPGGCTVAGASAVESIAEYLGVDAGGADKRVARLHCAGGHSRAVQLAAYQGHGTCRGAHAVGGGGKACVWGCLSLADCEVACTFDAIRMNADGLPVVDVDKCTACGDCVDACPRKLFDLLPLSQKLLVQCKVPLAGDEARRLCQVACDACGRCAQDGAPGLIRMENNLPVVDLAKGGPATPNAVLRCPTGAIQWVDGAQFTDIRPLVSRVKKNA
jgi:Na+-translocating ferredoxin:NAD+ oxidoreductase subunit B